MADSESEGSCAAPPPPPRTPPLSPFQQQPFHPPKTPDKIFNNNNNNHLCFACKQEGHWFKDCPSRTKPTTPQHAPPTEHNYPELQCKCGRGTCIVLTSRTDANPGRRFYKCPAEPVTDKCNFFKWCDEVGKSPVKYGHNSPVKPVQPNGVGDAQYPLCSCKAGRCRLLTVQDGEFKGRRYFGCCIKKGQGACNHFEWYDSPSVNPLGPLKTRALQNDQPSYNLLPEEPKSPPMVGNQVNGGGDSIKPEETIVPESPPPPSRRREGENNNEGIRSSPMKKLDLHDGSPSKLGKCFRCGREGHLTNQCDGFLAPPCFKCGSFGRCKNNCTAQLN